MSDALDLSVLAESFDEVLAAEWPREKAVALSQSSDLPDPALWDMLRQLGWTALTAPEAHGGLELGLSASARLQAALGAAVAPVPMLGTFLAIELLTSAGTPEQQSAWLPGLADGSVRVAFAGPETPALPIDGTTVSATVADMLDAPVATVLVVPVVRHGKSGWWLIDASAATVSTQVHAIADRSRTLGTVTLAGHALSEADLILPTDHGALTDHIMRHACVLLAADAIGGGEAALAGTVDYLKVREQFGKVIGSFQALKHRVADHQAALVGARELTFAAADMDGTDPSALLAALSAKAHVTRVAAEVTRDCIQLFGGVGYTVEYFPHLYLKRAKLNELLFGNQVTLLDRIADMLEAA
jgi:alkylation response protein AidB-like acyl-CoA dehydrogenase